MKKLTANFSRWEFACHCKCGADDISPTLVQKLQVARDFLNDSIDITSGVRCVKHNKTVGGKSTSSHIKRLAVDIKAPTFRAQCRLILALGHAGFVRVGVSETDGFIHVDIDLDKTQKGWFY